VTLVTGPTALAAPRGMEMVRVESATEMHAAVMARVAAADVFIGTAAVADYRPATPAHTKIKRRSETLELELVANADILSQVAHRAEPPFTVGFAAETDAVEETRARSSRPSRST
jgi:phosphopantothenoylcysteine decarboxylase/phosphopantothenate--cysteine ligase